MIEKITIISELDREILDFKSQECKVVMDCSKFSNTFKSFDIEIEFSSDITSFRNHDYTWVDTGQNIIAAEFSPKIIKLENGFYVLANINDGIWEFDKRKSRKIIWRFNPEFSKPLTVYSGAKNAKVVVQANSYLNFLQQPTLLFSNKYALEISRSKIPFSAIACFTDHCDFDTLQNLKVQRKFFKTKNIKTTKGFFLNHFSKRAENASLQNDYEEIELWEKDSHELCYHSLSQSIKSQEESFSDFNNFTPPFSDVPVWIDHGYQPYNLSLFQNNNFDSQEYELILSNKSIKILWNYIDSGTATNGVINQLNPNHFTLSTFLNGNQNLGKIKLWQEMIKNIVFHYLHDDKTISKYKATAQHFKKIVYQKQLKTIPIFIKDFSILFKAIMSVFFSWKTSKKIPFKLSKYTPLFFKHTINKKEFVVFQTLEMIDFCKSLSKENIELVIKEKGVFIAHTYFSDNMSYHNGKLLVQGNTIDQQVDKNFDYLSERINKGLIWNPTLSELYNYLEQFENTAIDFDSENNLIVTNTGSLTYRKIQ